MRTTRCITITPADSRGVALTHQRTRGDTSAGRISSAESALSCLGMGLLVPLTVAAEFQQNLRVISDLTKNIRHQWAVIGGDDSSGDTNRGSRFLGYLQ